ncbi:putative Xaa-Pro aminopeptidase pepP [Penicillium oxalicum]|uniref:putative Xaa-Pro aminopeptidase pepP n=1 Tax=Penicillium oxalicum TaxID=69781 RepID=UPI0020B8867A|nr:putative Xaa-Pro aminopeptidase pepP [Penicillium oxalicum]KAI2787776.1 putative Xaa-Pro aminopeptidase pepP [Penicillium oxalicum]
MASVDQILAGKYPGKAHARRVAQMLKEKHGDAGMIYLEAQRTRMIEDSDEAMHFRQRRPFFYFTGCNEPDAAVVYDVKKDQLTLFIAPIDPESVIWSGLPLSPEQAKALYDVDAVQYTNEVNSTLASIASAQEGKTVAFAIDQQVSEGINFAGFAQTNLSVLKDVIGDARVVKDAYEIALLRKANDISTLGHIACMKAAGKASNEREVEAEFIKTCIAHGAREMSYHPIFAAGENGATLHYVKNDDSFFYAATTSDPSLQGQRKGSLLIDAGGEYQTYCADITRVVPLAGRFPEEARQIYEIVLEMQTQCIAMLKEGVLWDDVHALAHRVAIKGLLKLGILQATRRKFSRSVSAWLSSRMVWATIWMFRFLRTRGKLPAGSVITVEPGIYFCRFIIDPVLESPELGKYINTRYWSATGAWVECASKTMCTSPRMALII